MQKSFSKKHITIQHRNSPYRNPISTRPHRQLSHKEMLNQKNIKSISSFNRKQKKSPQRQINSSFKIVTPLRKIQSSIQTICNIFSQENRLVTVEDVMKDILQKLQKSSQLSVQFRQQKIQMLLRSLKYYIGRVMIRIIECQKSRLNAINERYYKLAQSYQKQIQEVKKKKENEFSQMLKKRQGQLGRKLQDRNLRCIFNTQLHNEMQSTGGLNLQQWIRGSFVLKNYIIQLQLNKQKFLKQLQIDKLQSVPNIFDRQRQSIFDDLISQKNSSNYKLQKKEEKKMVKIYKSGEF